MSIQQDVLAAPFATECDLVMKGGITSGVVYPLAIVEISRAFRLQCIGGTSAGAIAAAAAAAAELRRQRDGSTAGFDELGQLPDHLIKDSADGPGNKLLAFFKPVPALAKLFAVALGALNRSTLKGRLAAIAWGLLRRFWPLALLGFALAVTPLLALPLNGATLPAWAALALLGAFTALVFVTVRAVYVLLPNLVANGFGFCSGMNQPGDADPAEALTPWLASYLDRLSGQPGERPLTFGDLWDKDITLQMMTTCLTLGRPFRLPLRDEEEARENKQFYWRRDDFLKLFPQHIVDWMEQHQRPAGRRDVPGFLRLPEPRDLPVVVAVRMSLSFPVLLSAVPLHAVRYRDDMPADALPEICWFTDGGVGSNFPIHFFDAPLPGRPTFGLDLGHAEHKDVKRVVFPRNNSEARLSDWKRFSGDAGGVLVQFLSTLLGVAKDWNHDTLSRMPGFRDRIGLIRLTSEEGGLNLSMPKERIEALTAFGREAGLEFVRRFGDPQRSPLPPHPMNWENHQSIRLRILLASMTELLERLEKTRGALDATNEAYERFFSPEPVGRQRSYPFTGLGRYDEEHPATQAALAQEFLARLSAIARWLAAAVAANRGMDPRDGAPKPPPELKPRPRI